MKLLDAANLARELMDEFGLTLAEGWRFRFDSRAVKRFGQCKRWPGSEGGLISLSSRLVELNGPEQVEDTIRHEIAHALAPIDAYHGPQWRRQCMVTGANPARCYDGADVITPPAKYRLTCESGCEVPRHRNTGLAYSCRRHGLLMTLEVVA